MTIFCSGHIILLMSPLDRLRKTVAKYRFESDFAIECGVSRQYMNLILKGERGMSWPLAKRVSAVTGLPPAELMEIGRDRVA